jgi:hypothetical protein
MWFGSIQQLQSQLLTDDAHRNESSIHSKALVLRHLLTDPYDGIF